MWDRASAGRLTRLVATIGPASVDRVPELVEAGLDVARINLSHGSAADHARAAANVRDAATAAGRPVAILVDLPGPKLRLGPLPDPGVVELRTGSSVSLHPVGSPVPRERSAGLPIDAPGVLESLRPGDRILLADGAAELRVLADRAGTRRAEVVRGGSVRSRAGVNVPAERLPPDALTPSDLVLLREVLALDPDHVGLSFVRRAADVRELRSRLPAGMGIVAKIETRPAVADVDAILEAADAIMVARGDLGVELPFEEVPLIQKDLVRAAGAAGRPSIVATQLLETMLEAPRPTRAEASDVANAVLDGADALMLSGETAIGAFPVLALDAAARICVATESRTGVVARPIWPSNGQDADADPDARALADAAIALVDAHADLDAIVCVSRTGRIPRMLAARRPRTPIVALTPDPRVARSLGFHRGVVAHVMRLPVDAEPVSAASIVASVMGDPPTRWRPEPGRAVVVLTSSAGEAGPERLEVIRVH